MPATLYLRPQPRAFFLLTSSHALVFRQADAAESKAARSVVVAEFLPIDKVDTRGLVLASRTRTVDGVLGVTSVPTERSPVPEIFLVVVSASSTLSPLVPQSKLRPCRVESVEFHSLSSSFWDLPHFNPSTSENRFGDLDPDDPYDTPYNSAAATVSPAAQQGVENPCHGMRRYLESGSFFFAEDCKWDISTRLSKSNWIQARHGATQHPLESFDERFVWNATLIAPLLAFRAGLQSDTRARLDRLSLLLPVIQGFVGSKPVDSVQRNEASSLGLISRLSWKRAGARFRTRGIDDDGQVANFVETEVLLATESVCMSYVQVRGSVPLFWQQPTAGIQTLQQKVELTRPPQATQSAFDKHFLDLLHTYHSAHAINLLGHRDAESMLSSAYSDHCRALQQTLQEVPVDEKDAEGSLNYTSYDFHAQVKAGGNDQVRYDFERSLHEVVKSMEDFGWTAINASGETVESQRGVFRTNCLDCLDRTNYIQDVISSITLSHFLASIRSSLNASTAFSVAHRELWADNGDQLSRIYAGTGAINTSATRSGKKTFAGLLSDATKSVSRAYINQFQDKGKQTAIDTLLGMMAGQRPVILFDPISDSVQSALVARLNEYSSTQNVSFFVGTWNLNGKPPDERLDSWLFPLKTNPADIYMIAFQEIVELTASQILQTDPAKRRMWEATIMDAFQQHHGDEFLLFRSAQLVGTALILIVRASLSSAIRSVESATKKTGLQGLSGNKGGVGIRFDLLDSPVCLMTCHLAAGHSNIAERNADYRTISAGLSFLKGKMINDHEVIIWAADFNYRIDADNLDVRESIERGELDPLLASDQLVHAMDEREVFIGYDEGPLRFAPTYKYDNGTNIYDTSEKARIPSWTDRVLFRGPLKLKEYNRAELRLSDHRPVYALFEATIRKVDTEAKNRIRRELEAKALGSNVEARVDKALRGTGINQLAAEMTRSSVSPGPGIERKEKTAPKLPPRPIAKLEETPAASNPLIPNLVAEKVGLGIPAAFAAALYGASGSTPLPPTQPLIPAQSSPSFIATGMNGSTRPLTPQQPKNAANLLDSDDEDEMNPSIIPVVPDNIQKSQGRRPPPVPTRSSASVVPTLSPTSKVSPTPPRVDTAATTLSASSGSGRRVPSVLARAAPELLAKDSATSGSSRSPPTKSVKSPPIIPSRQPSAKADPSKSGVAGSSSLQAQAPALSGREVVQEPDEVAGLDSGESGVKDDRSKQQVLRKTSSSSSAGSRKIPPTVAKKPAALRSMSSSSTS